MATPKDPGKTAQVPRRFWPTPIGALVPTVVRPAFRRRAPAAAQLLADWPALVGPVLAAVTEPRRLSDGVLTLSASGPVALELAYMADSLRARLNGALGAEIVRAVRIVHGQRPVAARSPPPRQPAPDPPGLPEGELGQALRELHRTMTSRTTR